MAFFDECYFSSTPFRYISIASQCMLSGIPIIHSVKCSNTANACNRFELQFIFVQVYDFKRQPYISVIAKNT